MRTMIVLGATGLVGANVVRSLLNEGNVSITAITRRAVHYDSTRVQNKVIDFDQLHEFTDVFEGDVLLSCLGTTLKQAGSLDAQRLVDFDYQYQCAVMAADNGVKQYALVSSSGANAGSISPYLKMKGELEDAIRKLPFECINIFQPSLLLGERPDSRIAERVGGIVLPIVCKLPGLGRYRPIHAEHLAQTMVDVSRDPAQGTHVYRLDDCFPK